MEDTEVPPEWMWPFDDLLDEWWEDVAERRKQRWGRGSDDHDDDVAGPMTSNDFARNRR